MEKLIVKGGNKLNGRVVMHGAKNAFLPIMAGCILATGTTTLFDFPKISDICKMAEILKSLGVKVEQTDRIMQINTQSCNAWTVSSELMQGIRASIFLLGPLLAKFKKAKVAYPGGCAIGSRPIDLHLDGLKSLNVKIVEQDGQIFCDGSKMKSGTINLKFASVGATENLVMASVLLKGATVINNVAKEPEIVDLCNFLNSMGAKIYGAGTETITIEGVNSLKPICYSPISDRIIAGTFLLSTLITGGKVEISNINANYLQSLLLSLKNNLCDICVKNDKIIVTSNGKLNAIPLIKTLPYPNFPTDLQAQMMAVLSVSNGVSEIYENVFNNRFNHATQLVKMGANIVLDGNKAIITGVDELFGNVVNATDLRAGASLVMAGLRAKGETVVTNIHYIDRGYERFEDDLNLLGANIKRVDD